MYKDKKPDILLVDITMPEMNGLELTKKIRETDEITPIIVLSAHSHKEFLFEAIKLNLVDYLIKPVNRNEFKSLIESTIEKISNNQLDDEDERVIVSKTCYWDKKTRLFFIKKK